MTPDLPTQAREAYSVGWSRSALKVQQGDTELHHDAALAAVIAVVQEDRTAEIEAFVRRLAGAGYPSKAAQPFWLDGGYDRELVEACPHHPTHKWWEFRIGDVIDCSQSHRNPDERMVICQGCYVPRCGYTTEANPCMLPRHHRELHLFRDGTVEDTSVWPGSDKPPHSGATHD